MKVVSEPGPPAGVRRTLARLPIGLYRAHLGWLLGGRFLLLHHRGRKSGRPRQVVLEVVEHSPDRSYVLASGFGTKSDWYRNLLAAPDTTAQVGRRVLAVHASPIGVDEGAELMARYAGRHPRAGRALCKLMGFEVDGSRADFLAAGRRIPFVRLSPTGG
ncbi:nitroreductase family deazaflavin-dependent oxidoreductase [Rhodococcus spelaei]|uniref:Nitroreductase family deazaflavin-dependent oxidoreductase n=1 Tax=Rhodococcus spelaei TaxID=2546320 RepID=A0A541BQN7_9NOCA|nr:nitroreductase family deazaflavin-dependent oxidoreductase [Rhodococcus spelaei]TQF74625.1 nitroreductase family deazaflavin-dependent oxidoreductase [Rhodococcus spelaei]